VSVETADIVIVGAGIAGTSAAAKLARTHRVVLLEGEDAVGYHSTGRSAALFSETYGNVPVRALTRASRPFLAGPPAGFSASPLIQPRGVLHAAGAGQASAVDAFLRQNDVREKVRRVSPEEALALCPALRPQSAAAGGLYEAEAADIDVHGLHQGFLRQFREQNGRLVRSAKVTALRRDGAAWQVASTAGDFQARILVNAAGAWADPVAQLAGLAPLGIQPYRRTIALAEVAGPAIEREWPMALDVHESYYFKPDAGLLLLSPADETPVDPCDAQPLDLDVAIAVDRVEAATRWTIQRIRRAWAGLRSFAPDRTLVIGFDPEAPGFFWLAGQGGYGIQTSPAAATLAAALVRNEALPPELAGFDPGWVSPARFAARPAAT
jgi:D-arginine dehydrogenase